MDHQTFEAKIRQTTFTGEIKLGEDGRYTNPWVQGQWENENPRDLFKEGYQAALQSPEVRELVEALEDMVEYGNRNESWQDDHQEYLTKASKALEPFLKVQR